MEKKNYIGNKCKKNLVKIYSIFQAKKVFLKIIIFLQVFFLKRYAIFDNVKFLLKFFSLPS